MSTFIRGATASLIAVGLLAGGSAAFAAGTVECAITKDGKQTTQNVASSAECARLGGKVMPAKAQSGAKPEAKK